VVSLARASTVFSELVSYFCLRFRVEPVPSAHRGRVQWWHKLYCQFFFSAGNVFFERNRKIPLCFFIFPEGPRVTEVTKLEIFKSVRRLGIYRGIVLLPGTCKKTSAEVAGNWNIQRGNTVRYTAESQISFQLRRRLAYQHRYHTSTK